MKYEFNDALLLDEEVYQKINQLQLLIINNDGKILMDKSNYSLSLPTFTIKDDLVTTKKEVQDSLNIILDDSFVEIKDYQYQYSYPNCTRTNRLLTIYGYIINNDDIKNDKYEYLYLSEILKYLDSNNHYYDNRILKTILYEYINNNLDFIFNTSNYNNYVLNANISDAVIEDTIEDTKKIIYDNINFINDDYAIIDLNYIYGIKNDKNDELYTDLIGTINDQEKYERFLSLYVLKSFLGPDYKVYLTNDYKEYKDLNATYCGLPMFIIKGNMLDLMEKICKNKEFLLSK